MFLSESTSLPIKEEEKDDPDWEAKEIRRRIDEQNHLNDDLDQRAFILGYFNRPDPPASYVDDIADGHLKEAWERCKPALLPAPPAVAIEQEKKLPECVCLFEVETSPGCTYPNCTRINESSPTSTDREEGADHVHRVLPSGAVARVSPDASPELLNSLDKMAKLAMKMPEIPEEINAWIEKNITDNGSPWGTMNAGIRTGARAMWNHISAALTSAHQRIAELDTELKDTRRVLGDITVDNKERVRDLDTETLAAYNQLPPDKFLQSTFEGFRQGYLARHNAEPPHGLPAEDGPTPENILKELQWANWKIGLLERGESPSVYLNAQIIELRKELSEANLRATDALNRLLEVEAERNKLREEVADLKQWIHSHQ